jgi:glycosyltransferase involved in cell wall biosynthesis
VTILFGHPTGNPNSHQAALAHFEAGRLEAFCVPWMPSARTASILDYAGMLSPVAKRLSRRHSPSLTEVSTIQNRMGEMRRLMIRAIGQGTEALAYDANDWLMHTMSRECHRSTVTAVHAYEDCSLLQFREAKRLGKACIYDMPIGYYAAWKEVRNALAHEFADWLPKGVSVDRYERPEQKYNEMSLADLVLAPSRFVAQTIERFRPNVRVEIAPFGTDFPGISPQRRPVPNQTIKFLFVGQCSLRKGVPLLLKAWEAAALKEAKLQLIGSWRLAEEKKRELPSDANWIPPMSREQLDAYYAEADVFVFPSYFEGRALVICEALSAGLPVVTTPASGAEDLIDESCGRLVSTGDLDALVECLRWFNSNRECLPKLGIGALKRAFRHTWGEYRRRVSESVKQFS